MSTAWHCASHGDGLALRLAMKRCARCGWDGGAVPIGPKVKGWNGRSVSARRRDVKPNGSHNVTATTAGQYTRMISRDHATVAARRADRAKLTVGELAATDGWS